MVTEQFPVPEHAGVGARTQRRTAKEATRQNILFVLNMITSPFLYALSFLFLFNPVSLALLEKKPAFFSMIIPLYRKRNPNIR
jgi:hypothetical protein